MDKKGERTIFKGHKEYLEKSFIEELNYKIWSTKGARFEADKRLTIISRMSNISLSILSAYLIIAGLISVYNLNADIKINLINYVVTALSIILLVLSLYENSKEYSKRAKEFHNCGLELSKLYNKLRIFKTLYENPTLEERRKFATELSKEYEMVLDKYENHQSIDYNNFKLNNASYFGLNYIDKTLIYIETFWVRYGWYSLIISATPIIIYYVCTF